MSVGRVRAAEAYVRKALASAAPVAVDFQRSVVEDEEADLGIRFKASEALLDRFMGKAAQEIRLGETEVRPIVFSDKLRILKEGMERAVDVASRGGSALGAFEEKVTERMVDTEGVEL